MSKGTVDWARQFHVRKVYWRSNCQAISQGWRNRKAKWGKSNRSYYVNRMGVSLSCWRLTSGQDQDRFLISKPRVQAFVYPETVLLCEASHCLVCVCEGGPFGPNIKLYILVLSLAFNSWDISPAHYQEILNCLYCCHQYQDYKWVMNYKREILMKNTEAIILSFKNKVYQLER